jgi:hypothetical protein
MLFVYFLQVHVWLIDEMEDKVLKHSVFTNCMHLLAFI